MSLPKACQSWRIPDELWEKVKSLLPAGKPHPLGCHRPRVDDRKAMDAERGVSGKPWMRQAFVQAVVPTDAFKNGRKQVSLRHCGCKGS